MIYRRTCSSVYTTPYLFVGDAFGAKAQVGGMNGDVPPTSTLTVPWSVVTQEDLGQTPEPPHNMMKPAGMAL